jgi:hypothetical protein
VNTLSAQTEIVGAGIEIIQNAQRLKNTIAAETKIVGAGVAIITLLWSVQAASVHATVNSAGVTIINRTGRSENAIAIK